MEGEGSIEVRFSVSTVDGAAVVSAAGEFDLSGRPAFMEAREKALALGQPIVIDLRDCAFIDSTGVGLLVESLRVAAQQGQTLALVAGAPQVHRVLELCAIPKEVPYFQTLAAAVAHLVPHAGNSRTRSVEALEAARQST